MCCLWIQMFRRSIGDEGVPGGEFEAESVLCGHTYA